MGGSKKQTTGYRYGFDIHMGLGMPLDEIIKIKSNKKTLWEGTITESGTNLYINQPEIFGGDKGEGGVVGDLEVYFGEETQTVSARVKTFLSSFGGLVPEFRNVSTAFFSGLITSNNPYPKAWEFLRRGGARLWDSTPWHDTKLFINLEAGQIKAMNPVHILYLILTGSRFKGINTTRMDSASWLAAADQIFSEGFGLCIEWKRSDTYQTLIDTILEHISAEVYEDRLTGRIAIRLIRDDYDPDDLPLFDEDSGLLTMEADESSSLALVPSDLIVKYVDAIDGETKTVRATNAAVAARQGGRSIETVSYPGLPTGQLAMRVAQRDLKVKTSALKRYTVVFDRRARALSPGQPIRIRSRKRGIEEVVVRVGRIEDRGLPNGQITVVAVQDVFGMPTSAFTAPPSMGWQQPNRDPAAISVRKLLEMPYREATAYLDPANLQLLDPAATYVVALGAAPAAMNINYNMFTQPSGAGNYVQRAAGDWCPTGTLTAALTELTTAVSLSGVSNWNDVTEGMAVLIGDEVCAIDTFNPTAATMVVRRGCSDTVPVKHPIGTRVWFYEVAGALDPTIWTSGTAVQVKLLSNTSIGQLAIDSAPTDTINLVARQDKPLPPGNFQINGARYPTAITGAMTISWSHRDRLSQGDVLVDTLSGNIGPEAGVTYTIEMRDSGGALIQAVTGLTGTSHVVTGAPLLVAGAINITLWSVRGAVNSWQKHNHTITHTPAPPPP